MSKTGGKKDKEYEEIGNDPVWKKRVEKRSIIGVVLMIVFPETTQFFPWIVIGFLCMALVSIFTNKYFFKRIYLKMSNFYQKSRNKTKQDSSRKEN